MTIDTVDLAQTPISRESVLEALAVTETQYAELIASKRLKESGGHRLHIFWDIVECELRMQLALFDDVPDDGVVGSVVNSLRQSVEQFAVHRVIEFDSIGFSQQSNRLALLNGLQEERERLLKYHLVGVQSFRLVLARFIGRYDLIPEKLASRRVN